MDGQSGRIFFNLVVLAIAGSCFAIVPLGPSSRIIVSPSVVKAKDVLELGADLSAAADGGAEWLHFSVQDGQMVPKLSFGSPQLVAACRRAFPDTVLDVKLSCIEPERHIDDFAGAGADIISVHPESTLQLGAVFQKIEASGCAPGLVLNPATPLSLVEDVLERCSVVVIMLVNPGYGGPMYIETALGKIKKLRESYPSLHISVDGGVDRFNSPALLEAGANVLIAGGSIFSAENMASEITRLKKCRIRNDEEDPDNHRFSVP